MFSTARRLEDHIRECSSRHDETIERIKSLSDQTRGEFALVRSERDRMHGENITSLAKMSETLSKVNSGLWKAAALIAAAVLANYLSSHGFVIPGG